jgi:uncharacterized membrane protein YgcG
MTLRRLLPAAIAVAALVPASASAAVLKGTVVQHSQKSFVVAAGSGDLYRVHAASSPKARRTVRVSAKKLNNGSYKATSVKTTGRARTARLSGVVSYRKGRTFVVSSGGASLLVHGQGAKVGRKVLVRAKVSEDGSLDETSGRDEGHAGEMEIEGSITAIDTTARTITVTAADDSTKTITIKVPDAFDITKYFVGETIDIHVKVPQLTVTQNPDGTFTLVDSSADGTSHEADDPKACQGHDAGDDHGDDHGGDTGDDDGGDSGSGGSGGGSGSGSGGEDG